MTKRILLLIVLSWQAMATLTAFAQQRTDTTCTFRFLPQKDMFYVPWKGNGHELARLLECIERNKADIRSGRLPLYVDGYCDSGQTEQASMATAKARSNRVKSELITRKGLRESNFITHNHTSGGDFVTVRIILKKEDVPAKEDDATACAKGEEATTQARNNEVAGTSLNPEGTKAPARQAIVHEAGTSLPQANAEWYLRANLPRWATLTPDLGVEWRVNHSFGISVNGSWTSWSWNDKARRYALWEVMPELRYYIGKEKRGYLGAIFKAGQFNYKFAATGKQGDLMGGGLTGGYQIGLSSALALDLSVGVGYVHADYDRYTITNGVRVKRGNGSKNYWGVNHLGVSLVWNVF